MSARRYVAQYVVIAGVRFDGTAHIQAVNVLWPSPRAIEINRDRAVADCLDRAAERAGRPLTEAEIATLEIRQGWAW